MPHNPEGKVTIRFLHRGEAEGVMVVAARGVLRGGGEGVLGRIHLVHLWMTGKLRTTHP